MKSMIFLLTTVLMFGMAQVSQAQSAQSAAANKTTQTLNVQTNGKCDMCKARIEKAVKAVKGVKSAGLNTKTAILKVQYDPSKTDEKSILNAITQAGYNAGEQPANAEARAKLPNCCK